MAKYFSVLCIVLSFFWSVSLQTVKEGPCSNDFTFYPKDGGMCVQIRSGHGPPECPYRGGFDYDLIDVTDYLQFRKKYPAVSFIWYPAVRNTHSKTEFIEHLHKTINFNAVRASVKHRYEKTPDGNCVAYDLASRELLLNFSCSEKLHSICVHKSIYHVTFPVNPLLLTKINCYYSIFEASTCFIISSKTLLWGGNLKVSPPRNEYQRWIVKRLKEKLLCPHCLVYERALHGVALNSGIELENDPISWNLFHVRVSTPYELPSISCFQRFQNGVIKKIESSIGQYWCHAYLASFSLVTSNILTLKSDQRVYDPQYQFIVHVAHVYPLNRGVLQREDQYLTRAFNYFNLNVRDWSIETNKNEINDFISDKNIAAVKFIKLDERLERNNHIVERAVLWCKGNLNHDATFEELDKYRNYLKNIFQNNLGINPTYQIAIGRYCESTEGMWPITKAGEIATVNEHDQEDKQEEDQGEKEEGKEEKGALSIFKKITKSVNTVKGFAKSVKKNNTQGIKCMKCSHDYLIGAKWDTGALQCTALKIFSFFNKTLKTTPKPLSAEELKEISTFKKNESNLYMIKDTGEKLHLISNLMDFSTKTLQVAQNDNTTDKILNDLDNNLLNANNVDKGQIRTPNIIAQVQNFNQNSFSYISLMESSSELNTTSKLTFSNTAIDATEAKLFLYIPPKVIEYGKNISNQNKTPFLAAVTIFNKNSLFVEQKKERKVHGKIVSVLLSGLSDLPEPIQVSIRNPTDQKLVCGYWKYGKGLKGRWEAESDPKITNNGTLLTCSYDHLGHFGMLKGSATYGSRIMFGYLTMPLWVSMVLFINL